LVYFVLPEDEKKTRKTKITLEHYFVCVHPSM
jgi:hypothetical protein